MNFFKIEDFKNLAKDLLMGILELSSVTADYEITKILKNHTEGENQYFKKYISKIKRIYPSFRDSWRSYFNENQIEEINDQIQNFLEIFHEILFKDRQ